MKTGPSTFRVFQGKIIGCCLVKTLLVTHNKKPFPTSWSRKKEIHQNDALITQTQATDPGRSYHWKEHIRPVRGASLVAQWLRIHVAMQGTRVRALVWEDPTCHGATKPVRHNYWACALEAMLCNKRTHHHEKSAHCNEEYPRSLQLEKACTQQQRPNTAKNK